MIIASSRRPLPTDSIPSGRAPRHVLFLFDRLCGVDGGAESCLLKITRLLPPDRYRASIVTFWNKPEILEQFPCPVYAFPLQNVHGWQALKVARNIRRIIRTEHVSVVHTFFASSDLWGGAIAKLSGCPVLISSRRDMGFQLTAKHRFAYRLLGPLFNQVHTVSDAVRDFTIRQDHLDPKKVITLPNGVDMDRVDRIPRDPARVRAAYGVEDASHLIVDIGNVRRIKGFDVLVRTAAIVCREYPRAMFLVAGHTMEDDYSTELRALIASMGLTANFRLVGPCRDVFPLLQVSDVFCHLSRSDGLSNALLEAMASRLPCVVSRVGGNPEVVDEARSGFVVPSERPELAADRILTLLRYPDCAQRMGEKGRQIVERNFTADAMVRRLVGLYDDMLEPED